MRIYMLNTNMGTENREHGTGNREQGSENREMGTGKWEQGNGNREIGIVMMSWKS